MGGLARALTDRSLCCYLSDLAVEEARRGQGIGKRLIEETRTAAGGSSPTPLLLSAPTAVSFYQGIKMPQADNCFLYRRGKGSGQGESGPGGHPPPPAGGDLPTPPEGPPPRHPPPAPGRAGFPAAPNFPLPPPARSA